MSRRLTGRLAALVTALTVAVGLAAPAAIAEPAAGGALPTTHDSPPNVPADPDTDGRGCAAEAPGPYLNPRFLNDAGAVLVRATFTDPDAGDILTARITYWPLDDPSPRTTIDWLVDEPRETVQLEGTDLAGGATYAWTAQAMDGTATSPETAPCHFTVDKTQPELPTVTSTDYPPGQPAGGPTVPGEFTFSANGSADVVGFDYRPRDAADWQFVEADQPGGSATVTITPTDAGFNYVQVRSVDRAGARSWETSYNFEVFETRPRLFSATYPEDLNSGGYGVPGDFEFSSNLTDVVAYRYRHNDGPEQTVAADADRKANITIAPTRGGENILSVRSVAADGTASPVREYRFRVDTAPTLSFPDGELQLGSPARIHFAPRRPQVVAYEHTLTIQNEPQEPVTVPAGPDGAATITWTPTEGTWGSVEVRSQDADGTWSEHRYVAIYIDGVAPSVQRTGAGSAGEPGVFTFASRMANIVAYEYAINDSTVVSVPPGPDGTARVEWTPAGRGWHTVIVWARNADGVRSEPGIQQWWVASE